MVVEEGVLPGASSADDHAGIVLQETVDHDPVEARQMAELDGRHFAQFLQGGPCSIAAPATSAAATA